VFRPERGLTAMNFSACVIGVGLGLVMIYAAWDLRSVWLAVAALGLVAVSAWGAARSLIVRIAFDSESLHIVGFLRTRRIPRAAILSVDRADLEWPMVQWSLPGAADRWSPLTPMMLNSSSFLPASMYRRRHRFLVQLHGWAPDVSATTVRAGLWSRVMDGFVRMILAIGRSPFLRIVIALVLLVVAAGAYWLGTSTALRVIENDTVLPRGAIASVVWVVGAAEAAYWLTPLRRRNPRAWHVTLAILTSPLAALLIGAIFSSFN
jgi:hypothetical protein